MNRSWRNSLYARAALFLVLGCGSILGAVVVVSEALVEETVERLLQERLNLAQTTGVLFEQWLRADLAHLVADVQPLMALEEGRDAALLTALGAEPPGSMFERGRFVLDASGHTIASSLKVVPGARWESELSGLATLAMRQKKPVISSLQKDGANGKPFLVMVAPVVDHGTRVGFVGGLVQPAGTPLVDALVRARGDSSTRMDVIDREGVVVASTQRDGLYRQTDHHRVLAKALRSGRPLQGRCHSCHEGDDNQTQRANEVLAFSALPSLALGVAVHEPETSALAHAIALRSRIWLLGGVFGSLFLLFAGLSVRSVVRPITRLTNDVGRWQHDDTQHALPALGQDEVGELARALNHWRARAHEMERRQLHGQYLQRVVAAQEDERRRIARELHDTLAQDLSALRLELERLAGHVTVAETAQQLGALEQRTHRILVMVRQILLDLRMTVLDTHALAPTLQAHLERVQQNHGVRGVLTVHGKEPELRYDVALTLFRIFQEALQNVVLHAGAQHVFVTLSFLPTEVRLEIEDDGHGFDVAAQRSQKPEADGHGLGLLGMHERVRLLGGHVELSSQRDEGTTVQVVIPVEAS